MSEIRSELMAVLVSVHEGEPRVLTLAHGTALPAGPLENTHSSLQTGMRRWVERQTGLRLGYIEQLYTFADQPEADEARLVRISYLGLTRLDTAAADWRSWYAYFPWENRYAPAGAAALAKIASGLELWARNAAQRQRCDLLFGLRDHDWDDELALHRYELLWEAGLVAESPHRQGHIDLGDCPMARDHRRALATGITRLRAKIRYYPLIFELMPERFTLLQLQRTVEAIAGHPLHKQNFRRLILQQALVEETAHSEVQTQGRPARLYRFRHDALGARRLLGSKLPLMRPD